HGEARINATAEEESDWHVRGEPSLDAATQELERPYDEVLFGSVAQVPGCSERRVPVAAYNRLCACREAQNVCWRELVDSLEDRQWTRDMLVTQIVVQRFVVNSSLKTRDTEQRLDLGCKVESAPLAHVVNGFFPRTVARQEADFPRAVPHGDAEHSVD